MTMRLIPALLIVGAALAGCGNTAGPKGPGIPGTVANMVSTVAAPLTGGRAPKAAPAPIAPAAIEQLSASNGVIVSVPAYNTRVPAVPVAVNGTKVTRLGGTLSVTTQGGGFLVATRGTPQDLLASEVEGFGASLSRGTPYTRFMEWPAARDETRVARFTCVIKNNGVQRTPVAGRFANATLHTDECSGPEAKFINKYWIDSGNRLVKSEQWVSPTVGYLQIEHIF